MILLGYILEGLIYAGVIAIVVMKIADAFGRKE